VNPKTDTIEGLSTGKWVVEDGELNPLTPHESEPFNRLIESSEHRAKRIARRHFVIIGTSGSHDYLEDSTAEQRFWSISVSRNTKDL